MSGQRPRRPVEHLLGDLIVARLRLEWARARTRRGSPGSKSGDRGRHLLAFVESARRLGDERARSGEDFTAIEKERAERRARLVVQAERERGECGCWRCEDDRRVQGELPRAAVGGR